METATDLLPRPAPIAHTTAKPVVNLSPHPATKLQDDRKFNLVINGITEQTQ